MNPASDFIWTLGFSHDRGAESTHRGTRKDVIATPRIDAAAFAGTAARETVSWNVVDDSHAHHTGGKPNERTGAKGIAQTIPIFAVRPPARTLLSGFLFTEIANAETISAAF
jgi:hypothetical protein